MFPHNCQLYCSIQFLNTTFPPNSSPLFFNLILQTNFPTQFQQYLSPFPFTQFSHLTLPTNILTQFYRNLYFQNCPDNFAQSFSTIFYTQVLHTIFHTLCQSISPTLLPYSLNAASQILYTESLSSAIYKETRKVMQRVALGEEEKLLSMGENDILNMTLDS